MKSYVAYTIAYFIIYFPISVGLEAFVWRDEVIDSSYLLHQFGIALVFGFLMSLPAVMLKRGDKRERK